MKVLFLTIGAVYNIEDTGAYTDLLREFAYRGHEVYVVGSLEKRTGASTNVSKECGVHVLRVRVGNITKTALIEKGISTLRIGGQYQSAIKNYFGDIKFDLILYTTPPITLASLVRKFKYKNNAYTYLLLKDIFPQNSVDLQMLSKNGIKGLIYWYFRFVEKQLYKVSDKIGCMSQANIDYLKKHNPEIPISKIEECPNTINYIEMYKGQYREHLFIKYAIPKDKYILMYGGNFGKPQNVDYIVDALRYCSEIDNIHFILCGSGTDFYKIEEYVKEEKPKHITVINQLPFAEYSKVLNSCDVGLLFLDYRFTIPNFPSRLLDYMNNGLPVIAATDKNTDVGSTIVNGGFGWWIESRSAVEYGKLLKSIFSMNNLDTDIKKKSIRAKEYLKKYYLTSRAYETIVKAYRER